MSIPKGPASTALLARNGHIAALIREVLKAKGWSVADLNEKLGLDRMHTSLYQVTHAKTAPGKQIRPRLAKVLGVTETQLMPRPLTQHAVPDGKMLMPVSIPVTPPQARAPEVLGFSVDANGNALIKLHILLPVAQAMPLLRMLTDAGVVFGAPDG